MPSSAAVSAREILTGLHEVMAARGSVQAKLDRVVDGARRGRLRSAGPLRLAGLKLVAGMAKGAAVFHEPRVVVEHTVAEDIEAERDRVYSAFRKMREQIDNMTKEAEFGTAGGD